MTEEKLKSLLLMLKSPDKENTILALNLLDAIPPTPICFLLMKLAHAVPSDWMNHAPNCYNYMINELERRMLPTDEIAWSCIFSVFSERGSSEEMELLYKTYMDLMVTVYPHPQIKNIQITINYDKC